MFFGDSHWHGRDEEQSAQETVLHSLEVVEAAGGVYVSFMSNPQRPLTTLERCQEYLALGKQYKGPVKYSCAIQLTKNPEQMKRAVEAKRVEKRIDKLKDFLYEYNDDELGLKWATLAKEGSDDVYVGHFEDKGEIKDHLYDVTNPLTWSTLCRPESAEIVSFRKNLRMAEEAGFRGRFHVTHVSTLEVADAVFNYEGPLKVSCDVALHHIVFNNEKMNGPDGVWYKCNPPLRSEETRRGLVERVISGRIPILISDHAPHAAAAKCGPKPPSGMISGPAWPYVINWLRRQGMLESRIFDAAFANAAALYGWDVEPKIRRVDYATLEELQKFYPVDVYKEFKRAA